MKDLHNWTLTAIVGPVLTTIGLVIGLVKSYQANARKIVENSVTLATQTKRIDDMEVKHEKEIDAVMKRVDEVYKNNRKDHELLFTKIGEVGEGVAQIKGYLMGKKESEDEKN